MVPLGVSHPFGYAAHSCVLDVGLGEAIPVEQHNVPWPRPLQSLSQSPRCSQPGRPPEWESAWERGTVMSVCKLVGAIHGSAGLWGYYRGQGCEESQILEVVGAAR